MFKFLLLLLEFHYSSHVLDSVDVEKFELFGDDRDVLGSEAELVFAVEETYLIWLHRRNLFVFRRRVDVDALVFSYLHYEHD